MRRTRDEQSAPATVADALAGEGGTFEVRDGQRVQVTPPSKPHPAGDRPRDADGRPIGPDGKPEPAVEQGA